MCILVYSTPVLHMTILVYSTIYATYTLKASFEMVEPANGSIMIALFSTHSFTFSDN